MEEEKKEEEEETKEDESDEQEEQEDDEYQKELERRQGGSRHTPLEKATFSFKKTAEEIKRLGGDPSKIFGNDEERKESFSLEEVRSIIKEEVGSVRSLFAESEVETRISKVAKSDKEKALIKHLFNSRISRSENLDDDIEDAWLLANKHKMKSVMSELARGKKAKPHSESGDGQKREDKQKPKVNAADEKFAKSKGLVWSDTEGRFISKARAEFLKK
jgi:hypothetical protein